MFGIGCPARQRVQHTNVLTIRSLTLLGLITDKMLHDALGAEDAKLVESVRGEQGIYEMVVDSFRGKTGWLVTVVFVTIPAFVVDAVVAAVQFFQVETVNEMIAWACAFMFCWIAIGMMKVWYWMELSKNTVIREVKRVELQIAWLANRLTNASGE